MSRWKGVQRRGPDLLNVVHREKKKDPERIRKRHLARKEEEEDKPERGRSKKGLMLSKALIGLNQAELKDEINIGLQHSPISVRKTNDLRVSLKRTLNEPQDFKEAAGQARKDEVRLIKKRKLVYNQSEEHHRRRKELEHVPTKLSVNLKRHRPVGFYNPSNFCYRRSVMQSLVNLPVFANWLQEHFQRNGCNHLATEPSCVLCMFDKLVKMCISGGSSNTTRETVENVDKAIKTAGRGSIYDWAANTSQADAAEFIMFLVQKFLERTGRSLGPVQGLFQTQLVSEWSCKQCGEISTAGTVDETCLSVSLDLNPRNAGPQARNMPALSELLDRYFKEEVSGVRCERCGSKRARERRFRINAAPAVLFIHLKRFRYDLVKRRFTKMATKVRYDRVLELGRYMAEGKSLRYRLASVVAHQGSLKAGHYITFGKDLSGRSFRFDDNMVTEVTERTLLEPPDGFTPYILTYVSC